MEFLRKLVLQTQSHLKGLTLSQRLAIGSCVALIFVSLLWMVQWAADPELVPLLDQPLTAQELAPIQQRLDVLGITYRVAGETILVPPANRPRLIAQLSESRALPKDISITFSKLIEETSPWVSSDEQGWRRSVALSNELASVLREFDGVEQAHVFMDKNVRRTVNAPPVTPTASVVVEMARGMMLDKQRVAGIAAFVSGAVGGLDITKVRVTDAATGRSYSVPTPDTSLAMDDLEDRQKKEAYFADKIKTGLANIPGLLVVVHAELDAESRRETRNTYTKPIIIEEKSETMTQERSVGGGGPGVVPNTSQQIAAGGPADRMEKELSESRSDTKLESTVISEAPRHGLKRLFASVNVPRSYLAALFKRANEGKEPSDAELESSKQTQTELEKITRHVKNALAVPEDASAVVVDWFADDATVQFGDEVMEAGAPDSVLAMVRLYGGKAGLGALAVMSLFMMLMMVRKVSEGPVLPGEEPPQPIIRIMKRGKGAEETVVFGADPPPVGEAEAREQLLVGKEVDEKTLRTQQVVSQVADLVKEDLEASVQILRRWIDAEKQ